MDVAKAASPYDVPFNSIRNLFLGHQRPSVCSTRGPSANKATSIYDLIVADRLHLFAVAETWHDSVDSPQLIACTPPDYRYVEKARPRATTATLTTNCNHGGLCLFYASFLSAREVQLPSHTSGIEVLAVYLYGARRNVLVVVLYSLWVCRHH